MKKGLLRKFLVFGIIFSLISIFSLVKKDTNEYVDSVKYEGKTYVLLEYNMDIFTYNFNSNKYYEEDIIHPVYNDKWDIVYFNGDLFVLESQVEKATKYYKNDDNYEWFIVYEEGDLSIKKPISINKEELYYLYNMESINKKSTMVFSDIKQFIDIVKVSKDSFITALINLVHVEDSLYWKTEIMTADDREYIIELPDSLNDKIFKILNKK